MTQENWRAIAEVLQKIYVRALDEGLLFIDEHGNVKRSELSATAADDPTVKAGSRKRGAVAKRSEVSA